jgi:GMP synthase-like glutamine amidotransferase
MKFALIKADYVNDDLLAEHGDLSDMFRRFFDGVEIDVYEARHRHLPDPTPYAACLVTGSRSSVNDDHDWIRELLGFLRRTVEGKARTPIIGFCFGHQALAKALGGSVGKGPCEWNVGLWHVDPVRRPATGPQAFTALFNHREQVLIPPPGADVLAGTDRCPVQMIAIGDRALGLQFHPEYTLAYQEAIMRIAKGIPTSVLVDALRRNRALERGDEIAREWVLDLARYDSCGEPRRAGA